MSEAIWERPPDSRTMAVLGGLESTAKEPISPARTLPAPTPAKSRLTSSGFPSSDGNVLATAAVCMMQTMATTRASGTRRLSSSIPGKDRQGEARQRHREGAEHADAAGVEMEQGHGEARADQADQAPGTRGLIRAVHHRHDQDAGTERERVGIGLPNLAEDVDEAHQQMPLLPRRRPSRVGSSPTMMWTEMPARKPVVTGNRQQRGEPAGPQQADGDENDADQQRKQRGQLGIMRSADGGDRGQCAGEDRRDGRVRRDRHEAVGAEGGEGERAGGEGIEPGLRRHARQPRGRELPGDGDRRQHQPGDQIARQPSDPIAAQR